MAIVPPEISPVKMSPVEPMPLVSDGVKAVDDQPGPKYNKRYDFTSPIALGNQKEFTKGHPWEAYKALQKNAPIAWNASPEYGAGFWSVVAYEDIRSVELDTKTYSSQKEGINLHYSFPETRHPELYRAALNTMICLDQPWHLSLRREHMPYFTPAYVKSLQARVATKTDSLLDEMEQQGPTVDFVKTFSSQLPMFTLCEMLGIPEEDRPKLIEWMHLLEIAGYILVQEGFSGIDPQFLMNFLGEMTALFSYGQRVLKERRENPREDLLSAIANAQLNGELLSDEYLDGSWLLILFAGNDTTRNSLSGAIRLFSEFPDQRALLQSDWSHLENGVNEIIRMVSPVIYMRRTATKDTELHGQKIAEGEKVVLYYGAANREPTKFHNPDQFDITRSNANEHLAFGTGPHVCLGKRIANMQLETALNKILKRFPDIQWTGNIKIAPNNFVHAISSLEVSLKG